MGTDRSFKLRALLFLYSNANMVGCALSLLGPLLLFLGVIGPGWLWITAGLYAAGFAVGASLGQAPTLEREIAANLTADDMLDHLDTLIRNVGPQLTTEMNRHLVSVRSSVVEVLPRLLEGQQHDADLYTVRETVLRYLPETLANYVALPPAFRSSHVLKDGKTARDLLADQLSVLDEQLRSVVANAASADAQALLANGQFLEMKFRQPDFLER